GLLVFQAANPAAIYVIFICSVWPLMINTAVGVRQVPQDYLNVARVLNLSEWTVFRKILFPAALPHVITGVRLSIGVAWLVIVAAEMLTGGVGIGFWVWDEWNNLNVQHIIVAIFVVGIVGLVLEQSLIALARRFSYDLKSGGTHHEQITANRRCGNALRHQKRTLHRLARYRTAYPRRRVHLADRSLGVRQIH